MVEVRHSGVAPIQMGATPSGLVSPDGVAPSWMVGVSASVNLPLHHKVQKFSSGTSSPGWSRKNGRKMVVVVVVQLTNTRSNESFNFPTSWLEDNNKYKLDGLQCVWGHTAI